MEQFFEEITPLLPIIIPIALIQLGLQIAALIHIFRHETYRVGNRLIWVLVVVLGQLLGPIVYFAIVPIVYFAIGRGEE